MFLSQRLLDVASTPPSFLNRLLTLESLMSGRSCWNSRKGETGAYDGDVATSLSCLRTKPVFVLLIMLFSQTTLLESSNLDSDCAQILFLIFRVVLGKMRCPM